MRGREQQGKTDPAVTKSIHHSMKWETKFTTITKHANLHDKITEYYKGFHLLQTPPPAESGIVMQHLNKAQVLTMWAFGRGTPETSNALIVSTLGHRVPGVHSPHTIWTHCLTVRSNNPAITLLCTIGFMDEEGRNFAVSESNFAGTVKDWNYYSKATELKLADITEMYSISNRHTI